MFRCLVNFAFLNPPINGGVSRVGREVARELLTQSRIHPIFLVRARFITKFKRWLGTTRNVSIIPYVRSFPSDLLLRLINPDIIVSPLFGIEPFEYITSVPQIVSLPDTLALDHPELFSIEELNQRKQTYSRASYATKIITLSEYARYQLLKHLDVSDTSVQVIQLGSDGLPPPDTEALIDSPYVYYPANNWPHKRHKLLLQAIALISLKKPTIRLALSGGRIPNSDLNATIETLGLADKVTDLGYVEEPHVSTLLYHSEALLFTSQYEGFGMPVLEAMRAGCPVICAPLTSIPEVAGDAALYVDSDKPEDWASVFLERLPVARSNLIQRGYQQAARFTWAQTRREWVEAIVNVLT